MPRQSTAKSGDKTTGGKIMLAAIKLFAAQGYEGTSIKNISDAAKVNIAAVHYHFGSKEKLYRHLLESFGSVRLETAQYILRSPHTAEELRLRVLMFIEQYVDSLLEHPDLFRIVQREAEMLHSWTDDVFKGTFVQLFETLATFLSDAKKRSLVDKSLDARITARHLFNQITNQVRIENINKKYFGFSLRNSAQRKAWAEQTLHIFLHGVSPHGK